MTVDSARVARALRAVPRPLLMFRAFLDRSVRCLAALVFVAVGLSITPVFSGNALAQDQDVMTFRILMAREIIKNELPPLSRLDWPPKDEGFAGAKLAISDNNTTGAFLKQKFELETIQNEDATALIEEIKTKVADGIGFLVLDAEPDTVLAVADALADKDVLIINAGAPEVRLRQEDCRNNVLHSAPSRAMLNDALMQYLAWKQWREAVMILGPSAKDDLYAEAARKSAKKFGIKILEEKKFDYKPGSRRSDGGFEQVQQQIPQFMQGLPEHQVVIVADEGRLFGSYFPYRTWTPRAVVGTAGLSPASWNPAIELWGGTQFQNRFERLANRTMRPLDYDAWIAVRTIGEAATRKQTTDVKELVDYIKSPEFELAAFKGRKVTYREWNGQLRQRLILASREIYVTVSPQPGFLHQRTEVDTLGIDKPESKCKAYKVK